MSSARNYESTLLIVEGKEDAAFFDAIAKHLGIQALTIRDIGGKTRLSRELRTLSKEQQFLDQVVSLGIIRDADQSSKSTFQSVCSALNNAGLPVPRQPLKSADGTPRVTIMIMPTNKKNGILEDVCLESLGKHTAIRCADEYFES